MAAGVDVPAQPIARGRTAEIFDVGNGRLLKLFKAGRPETSVQREYDIARHLEKAGIPAPKTYGIEHRDGRHGILFEGVIGPSMFDVLVRKPWRFTGQARDLASLHFEIHSKTVPGLRPYAAFLRGEIERAAKLSDDMRRRVLKLLEAMPEGAALCHSDLHPDNVILTSEGPRIIDWADAASGNPLADVARTAVLLQFGPLQEKQWWKRLTVLALARLFARRYVVCYLKLAGADKAQLRRWEVISAAARLNTNIPEEHGALLQSVHRGLQQGAGLP